MQIDELIDTLGYTKSPNFIQGDKLSRATDYAHIFRLAQHHMRLHGVYVLQQQPVKGAQNTTVIPVAYLCEADTEDQAREIRRLTWNQNAAPFLIVKTPVCVRLFSTFNYIPSNSSTKGAKNNLDQRIELQQIATALSAFSSDSIDNGTLWHEYGHFVTPKARVDWTLLGNLEKLDAVLIDSGLDWQTSHALIGKYVYLSYLHQREILSPRRLNEWGIDPDDVFSRNATPTAFWSTLDQLDGWLNGSVFPLEPARRKDLRQEHLRKVAGVFCGDDTLSGQLHLPFNAYDFSVIPVETLSAIYEQFLHAHDPNKDKSRGKELGAYYTPIHLVNFMLDELNDRRPLQEGMTCFDPSCGSGAFLVQCFRRLIEARIRKDGNPIRRPKELRDELLLPHIFGVDRDGDACRVTELSLILTLLDYVDPPDLSPVHNFKLPNLHNQNIFEADFFNPQSTWARSAQNKRYAWVVGNPPWVELKPPVADEEGTEKDKDRHARKWIEDNTDKMPIGGNQFSEAFLWKVTEQLQDDGVAGMLVPAMTLFKSESKLFRRDFFGKENVWCVANFANMAEVLFAGRSREPALALFYSNPPKAGQITAGDQVILAYSPLVANQKANNPDTPHAQKDTWNIAINGAEIREITAQQAATGDPLVWKIAMWGSHLDQQLLQRVGERFDSLQKIRKRLGLEMNQGVELRTTGVYIQELVDKNTIETKHLNRCGRLYFFPDDTLTKITRENAHLREGRDDLPLRVSRGPHIIVDAARRFAVYSDSFIAVPARYVGIAGKSQQADLLKALALYLSSDFALYHQFFTSPQIGIYKSIANLMNLKQLPVPIDEIHRGGLTRWSKLHTALLRATSKISPTRTEHTPSLYAPDEPVDDVARLERELNEMVNESLNLTKSDTWLVSDLVHVRWRLIQGKVDPVAIGTPDPENMRSYCTALKSELDGFVEVATSDRYIIDVIFSQNSAMLALRRAPARPLPDSIRILPANSQDAQAFTHIRQTLLRKHSQWLYFERSLRCNLNGVIYLFKPMQRLHWLRSQALIDAGEIIADAAGGGPS